MTQSENAFRPINWRGIDDINKDLDHLETIKKDPNSPFGERGPMAVTEGQVLELKVRVLDPELTQVVLGRSFVSDEGSRIPGMAIDSICLNPVGQKNTEVSDVLSAIAQRMRDNPDLLTKLLDPNWQP